MAEPLVGSARRAARLFATLEREVPDLAAEGRARLGGTRIAVTVDGEPRFVLAPSPSGMAVTADGDAEVEIHLAAGAVDALTAGTLDLLEAIIADRVRVRGPMERVLRAWDAVALWVQASLRSASLGDVLVRRSA